MLRSATAMLEVVPSPTESSNSDDEFDRVSAATERLRTALPERTDNAVVVDLLEDDLREGLDGIAELETHFDDVLNCLETPDLRAGRIVDAADAQRALSALDRVCDSLQRVQRRLGVAAGRLAR